MTYKIHISPRAEKDLEKLDTVVKKRIKTSLIRFSTNPLTYAKKLSSSKIGSYRFRVGKYRIAFDLSRQTIIILRIGHRRDIYER